MMIYDKIELIINDFSISKNDNLITRADINESTGDIIERMKYFAYNRKEKHGIDFRTWGDILKIVFSPALVFEKGKHNLTEMDKEKLHSVICEIIKYAKELGINTNLYNGKVSRFDIAKDRTMEKPIEEYITTLKVLGFNKRMVDTEVGSSFYHGNNEHRIVFYDKLRGCIKKGYEIPSKYMKCHLLRCEYRILKNRKLENMTGLSLLKDVVNNLKTLDTVYQERLRELFI